jgi:outer membrane lipoprotein carrier protein
LNRKFVICAWCAVSAAFLGTGSIAAETAQGDGKILLDRFLKDVTTLSARFEQSLVDDSDVVVEESEGTVELSRPWKFRWAYTEPFEQLLVADGQNVWSYDADLMQVTVKPQQEILESTPSLLFGGSGDALEDFEYIGSFSERATIWVRLRPKNPDNGFRNIELGFTDGDLSRMIFSDNLEQTTLVALFDVRINQGIDASRFRFAPPPGVDVVGIPLVSDAAD